MLHIAVRSEKPRASGSVLIESIDFSMSTSFVSNEKNCVFFSSLRKKEAAYFYCSPELSCLCSISKRERVLAPFAAVTVCALPHKIYNDTAEDQDVCILWAPDFCLPPEYRCLLFCWQCTRCFVGGLCGEGKENPRLLSFFAFIEQKEPWQNGNSDLAFSAIKNETLVRDLVRLGLLAVTLTLVTSRAILRYTEISR